MSASNSGNDRYVVFEGDNDNYHGYGVRGTLSGVLYEADFFRDTAERIAELENSASPPADYEATAPILTAEGYSVALVTRDTRNKEVSPGRSSLAAASAPTIARLSLGQYSVSASVDADGHLTVVVGTVDDSTVSEIDTEVGCRDNEIGFRFTTDAVEKAHSDSGD
jgi:hypothetical protein